MSDKDFYTVDEMMEACDELKNNDVINYSRIDQLISIIKDNNVSISDLIKTRVSNTLNKIGDSSFNNRVITDVGIFKSLQDNNIDFYNIKVNLLEDNEISLLEALKFYHDSVKDHLIENYIHEDKFTGKDDILAQLDSIELRENLKNQVQEMLDKEDSKEEQNNKKI